MNVFELRRRQVRDYEQYVRSFIAIGDDRVRAEVETQLDDGLLWPQTPIGPQPDVRPGRVGRRTRRTRTCSTPNADASSGSSPTTAPERGCTCTATRWRRSRRPNGVATTC